ncbi:hypothetical protein BBF96_12420 [Anoxybacter fermentans]|uniref:DUF5723 domain-containing protein n=1 Tax=Anoxybacter fermentans TaxID=1323375 RepID=A0A3Q9HS75_9FIRM|nr:DUF5723 family protein [Anoxybacter fermentans]AZR74132.1 hypothetical protein BBF96_12420 [Anoxybacter fermentans]
MKRAYLLLGLLLLTMIFSGTVNASADIKGMGNAPGAAAIGDNAIEWNPAALNVEKGIFKLDLALLDTTLWTNSFSIIDILNYGGLVEGSDANWDEEEIEEILNLIPKTGFSINMDHTTRPKLIIGPVGFSTGINVHARGRLDKDLFELFLKGNTPYVDLKGTNEPEKILDLTDTELDFLATADIGLAFGIPLHKFKFIKDKISKYFDTLYFGTGYHYVTGFHANITLTDETKFYLGYDDEGIPTIRFEDNKTFKEKLDELEEGALYPLIEAIYPTDFSHIGTGSALDFGLFAQRDKLSFGVSLMNLGSITIKDGEIMQYGLIKDSGTEEGFRFSEEPVITKLTEPRKVMLPSKFNLGVSYKFRRWLLLGAQFSSTKAGENLRYNEIGAGLEFNPLRILPLRLGIIRSFAKNSTTYTGGLGIHLGPLKTDLAATFDYKSISMGVNTSIEF